MGGLSVRVLDSCAMRKLLACSVVVAVGVGVAFTPASLLAPPSLGVSGTITVTDIIIAQR